MYQIGSNTTFDDRKSGYFTGGLGRADHVGSRELIITSEQDQTDTALDSNIPTKDLSVANPSGKSKIRLVRT